MAQLTPLILTRQELERTLGVFFLGHVAATVLFGFNFFQTWRYSSRYSSDPAVLKVFTGMVCLLDLGTATLVSYSLYGYLVDFYPATIGLSNIDITLCAESLVAVLAVFLVQSYRVYHFWSVSKKAYLAIGIEVIVFGALALGIVRSIKLFQHRHLQVLGFSSVHLAVTFGQALTLLAGAIPPIAQHRFHQMQRQATDGKVHAMFDQIVLYGLTRFGFANAIQFGYLIAFVVTPTGAYWLPFHLCATKLYVNGFLNELNSRPAADLGHGSNQERTTRITLSRRSFTASEGWSDSHAQDSGNRTIQSSGITEETTQQQNSGLKPTAAALREEDDISDCTWDTSKARRDDVTSV